MFYYTYVLKSTVNGTFYIGWTTDLVHRVEEHNNQHVTSTKRYAPWVLVYYEACKSKQGAIEREAVKNRIWKSLSQKKTKQITAQWGIV